MFLQDPQLADVNSTYHSLVDNFRWEDTQEAQGKKAAAKKESPNPKQWKHDCRALLDRMVEREESEHFRVPVSTLDYPEYHRCVSSSLLRFVLSLVSRLTDMKNSRPKFLSLQLKSLEITVLWLLLLILKPVNLSNLFLFTSS